MGFKDATFLVRTKNPASQTDPEAPEYNYRVLYSEGEQYLGFGSNDKRGWEVFRPGLSSKPVSTDYATALVIATEEDGGTHYGVCRISFDEYF